jgi:hypothetical protein
MNINTFECKKGKYQHLLMPGEYVFTECRPAKIPYMLQTIKDSMPTFLISGILACVTGCLAFFDGDFAVKSFSGTVIIFFFSLALFALDFSVVVKRLITHRKVFYVITNKRIFFRPASFKPCIEAIGYEDFLCAVVEAFNIAKAFNVGTVVLPCSSQISVDLLFIPDAYNICAKINDFREGKDVGFTPTLKSESEQHASQYGGSYDSSMFS